jgi:hypothetical protein
MFIVVLKMLLFYPKKINWFFEAQNAQTLDKSGLHRITLQKYQNMSLAYRIRQRIYEAFSQFETIKNNVVF